MDLKESIQDFEKELQEFEKSIPGNEPATPKEPEIKEPPKDNVAPDDTASDSRIVKLLRKTANLLKAITGKEKEEKEEDKDEKENEPEDEYELEDEEKEKEEKEELKKAGLFESEGIIWRDATEELKENNKRLANLEKSMEKMLKGQYILAKAFEGELKGSIENSKNVEQIVSTMHSFRGYLEETGKTIPGGGKNVRKISLPATILSQQANKFDTEQMPGMEKMDLQKAFDLVSTPKTKEGLEFHKSLGESAPYVIADMKYALQSPNYDANDVIFVPLKPYLK